LGGMDVRDARPQRAPLRGFERQGIHVGADPLLAAGGAQQVRILGPAPIPVQPMLAEGLIERAAMRLLGVGKGPIDIENQCLELHANTRLARISSPSMVMSSDRK